MKWYLYISLTKEKLLLEERSLNKSFYIFEENKLYITS